jgi:hypothetical protein
MRVDTYSGSLPAWHRARDRRAGKRFPAMEFSPFRVPTKRSTDRMKDAIRVSMNGQSQKLE